MAQILRSLFNRGKQRPSELEVSLLHGTALAESGKLTSEAEYQRLLAESGLIMQDTNLERFFLGMAKYQYKYVDPVDGKEKVGEGMIPKNVSMFVLQSHLLRSGYIDPLEAQIMLLDVRCQLRRVKMKMTEQEYEQGGALIVDAAYTVIKDNILSSINGREILVMKSSSKSMEVKLGGK